jgi:dTDP-4-amino-4,6-dideoxy-D-galactose acyltransferase
MSEIASSSVCEYLEWDSDFFGRRIARVLAPGLRENLIGIERWCAAERIDCLYLLVDASEDGKSRLAEENAFRLVDLRVTLGLAATSIFNSGDSSQVCSIRDATENDIPALRAIAREAHRDSRFYRDGHFPEQKCDELFETWIEKSCRGWANRVIVPDRRTGPEGYLTCHIGKSGRGQIRLVGVAEKARGTGLGSQLVTSGLRWFAENGVTEVSVVTQGRNISAQQLYQKCGFRTLSVQIWFHRWFTEGVKANDRDQDSL